MNTLNAQPFILPTAVQDAAPNQRRSHRQRMFIGEASTKEPTMTITLRKSVNSDGEPLLTPVGPFDAVVRFRKFADQTGISPAEIVTSPLSGVPVPMYSKATAGQHRRWPGVKPEAMWHPLMWLPKPIRSRRLVQIGDEPAQPEDNDLWVARIMVEVATAARHDPAADQWIPLYDEASGGWLDILALYGIDIETGEGQRQVADWLDGASDPTLDSIDLADWFETDEQSPNWTLLYAWNVTRVLLPVAYCVTAYTLAEHLTNTLSVPDIEPDDLRASFQLVATIAAATFTEIEDEPEWWNDLLTAWDGSLEQLSGRILPGAVSRLESLALAMEEQADRPSDTLQQPDTSTVTASDGPDWDVLADAWGSAPPA